MAGRNTTHSNMRIWHRYLGFFLAGIMAVYALSGLVMIFRDTDFLKQEKQINQQLAPALSAEEVGKAIRMRELKFTGEQGNIQTFPQGTYNKTTGAVEYKVKSLPLVL